jgi:hypothetical protein
MIVALALMVVIGIWMTWHITHRHDSRLVGKWLFTRGVAPTHDDLRRAANRSLGDRLEWMFDSDGTGKQYSEQTVAYNMTMTSFTAFTWWTDGECVHVKWGDPQQGWAAVRQTLYEIRRLLQGDSTARRPDVYAYSLAKETDLAPEQFVLEFETGSGLRTDDTYYLTRIPPE